MKRVRVGIVGAGQLGRMLALAGYPLDVRCLFLDRSDQTPGAQVAPSLVGELEDAALLAELGQRNEVVTFDWWNSDGAMHLQNGVHTFVSTALNLRLELPAQSRKTISITAPAVAGDYDFWCDSCCGGRANAAMHGTLHVQA